MSYCGLSYQKSMNASIAQSDLNSLLQRFETNVESLDALLSNYNLKLRECIHRNGPHSNCNHVRIAYPRHEALESKTQQYGKNISTIKPIPIPPVFLLDETRTDGCSRSRDRLSQRENNPNSASSTEQISADNVPITSGYREALQRSYARLVNYISSADDISARLFQLNHLSQPDLERIQEARSTAKANERLLNALLRKPVEAYRAFLDELRETKQGHVLSILLSAGDDVECQHHTKLIRQHYVYLVETVEVVDSGLVGHLVADGVLTDRERTTVCTEWNRYRQAETLLWTVGRKSSAAFESFLGALCKTNQKHVSDTLRGIAADSEDSRHVKTERLSSISLEKCAKSTHDSNPHSKKRNFHRLQSQYSGLPLVLQVEISAKFLALKNRKPPTEEKRTDEHANTVLRGFAEMHKSCFLLENERRELSELNAALQSNQQTCEQRLRTLHRERSVLESDLFQLRLRQNDSQTDNERLREALFESKALNDRLTARLNEAAGELKRRKEAPLENEDFRRLKREKESLEVRLKATKSELEDQRNELKSTRSRADSIVKQIEKEAEIRTETVRLETESQMADLTRQSQIDKITIESLHNEIARLNRSVDELKQDNRRILKELKIEQEKFQRTPSACLRAKDSDATGLRAKHLNRLDIHGSWVEGAAAVDDRLYLILRGSSSLVVYTNPTPHTRQYSIAVAGMMGPIDIVACRVHRCIYIADSGARCVWRLLTDDGRCDRWLADATWPFTLSTTADGRVLVTRRPSTLDVYDSDSKLVNSVRLPPSIVDPWHAVETPVGTYLVIHGDRTSQRHGVTEITPAGRAIRSCGDLPGRDAGSFDRPRYLALDGDGNVLVADNGNSRIVVLDASLNVVQILLNKDDNGLKNPLRILCGEGRSITVANNGLLDTFSVTKAPTGGYAKTL